MVGLAVQVQSCQIVIIVNLMQLIDVKVIRNSIQEINELCPLPLSYLLRTYSTVNIIFTQY